MQIKKNANSVSLFIETDDEMRRLHLAILEGSHRVHDEGLPAASDLQSFDLERMVNETWNAAKGHLLDMEIASKTLADDEHVPSRRAGRPAPVRLLRDATGLTISLPSPDDAQRFAAILRAGPELLSRPEYFLRTGLSAPQVADLAATISDAAQRSEPSINTFALEPGIGAVEFPWRPRPRIPYLAAKYFNRGTGTPIERVQRYRDEETDLAVDELRSQIGQLLADNPDEEALRVAWTKNGRAWYPTDDGITYRDWFTTILTVMNTPRNPADN